MIVENRQNKTEKLIKCSSKTILDDCKIRRLIGNRSGYLWFCFCVCVCLTFSKATDSQMYFGATCLKS